MQVILQERIPKVGQIGDTVSVKAGFGRNYLIPQGKALPATPENLKAFEARRAELEAASAKVLAEAQERVKAIEAVGKLTVVANASEEGKLFGSIGPREVVEAAESAGLQLEKREVTLPEGPVRELGEVEVHLILHADVHTTLMLHVEADKTE